LAGALILVIFGSATFTDGLKKIIPTLILVLLFTVLLFPALNDFTGGALEDRFSETSTTNRSRIAESDLRIFQENPVLGVGVGVAYGYRERFLGFKAMTHTEFSRLIAEHGMFGIVAILMLGLMAFTQIRKHKLRIVRALAAGAVVWTSFFMLNAGMRLAAPSFIWGLIFITVIKPSHMRPFVKGQRIP
jgi:hypothetical protein